MPELKPRTTTVVIYQGDDLDRLAELRRAVDVARRHDAESEGARRGGDTLEAPVAEAAYDAFVDEAAERAVEVRLEAVGRKVFRNLIAEHPPREVEVDGKSVPHEDDALYEVNVESFPDALLPLSLRAPEFASEVERTRFLEDLSDGDFERLFNAAFWLNKAPGGDPKDSRFSAEPLRSNET